MWKKKVCILSQFCLKLVPVSQNTSLEPPLQGWFGFLSLLQFAICRRGKSYLVFVSLTFCTALLSNHKRPATETEVWSKVWLTLNVGMWQYAYVPPSSIVFSWQFTAKQLVLWLNSNICVIVMYPPCVWMKLQIWHFITINLNCEASLSYKIRSDFFKIYSEAERHLELSVLRVCWWFHGLIKFF